MGICAVEYNSVLIKPFQMMLMGSHIRQPVFLLPWPSTYGPWSDLKILYKCIASGPNPIKLDFAFNKMIGWFVCTLNFDKYQSFVSNLKTKHH